MEVTIDGKTGKYAWSMLSNTCTSLNIDSDWPPIFPNCVGDRTKDYLPQELVIGGIPVKVRTTVGPALSNDYLNPYGLSGILGGNVFAGYWCEVSFSTQKIILHRQKPAGYTQSAKGHFLANNVLLIPGIVDGTDYGFVISGGSKSSLLGPISIPLAAVAEKPAGKYAPFASKGEHFQYLSKDRTFYWVKTGTLQVLGDTFWGIVAGTDPDLYLDEFGIMFLGRAIGMRTGILTWDFLKNYDHLFDFTSLSGFGTSTEWNTSPETTIWYAARSRREDREAIFPHEYPGSELEAFVYCTPQGADLFLS
jgi:hypothetical protein